jgi:hypothetical protein
VLTRLHFQGRWAFDRLSRKIPAAKKSDNRSRGTLKTKSIKVNREVIREFIMINGLPAIEVVWHAEDVEHTILI